MTERQEHESSHAAQAWLDRVAAESARTLLDYALHEGMNDTQLAQFIRASKQEN